MADLQHVQSGQPLRIPAADWNKIIDATRAHFEKQLGGGTRPAHIGQQNAGIIFIRNDTGADRKRFDVVGLGEPIIGPDANADEFKRQVAMIGLAPTASHLARFAVLQEPIVAGGIGRAVVDGITIARANLATTDPHTLAPIAGGSILEPHPQGGTRLIWAASTGSDVWCIVRLGAETGLIEAVITGSTGKAHDWEERVTSDAGVWTTPSNPRSGTGDAFEVNGAEEVPTGTRVTLHPVPNTDDTVSYIFTQPLPEVEQQYMVLQLSDNGSGTMVPAWDWVRAHS
jgi:hypothetical protein